MVKIESEIYKYFFEYPHHLKIFGILFLGLCSKFQVYLTPPSGFLATGNTFFTNMRRKYFSLNILTVPEVEFLNFDQN